LEPSAGGIEVRVYGRCGLGLDESKLAQVQEVSEYAVVGELEGGDFAGGVEACPFWRGGFDLYMVSFFLCICLMTWLWRW
jgi:hypothetical protein